jgi:hypothetical protein
VTQGASVLGDVFYPTGPIKTGTVSDFEIGLFIGTGHYVFDAAGEISSRSPSARSPPTCAVRPVSICRRLGRRRVTASKGS